MLTPYERAMLDMLHRDGPEPLDGLSISAVDHLKATNMAMVIVQRGVEKLALTPAGSRAALGLTREDVQPELEAV